MSFPFAPKVLASFFIAATLSMPVSAEILATFDTLGPNNSFLTSQGWSVGGGSVSGPTGANFLPANRFLAGVDGTLAEAALVIWRNQGSPQITINLHSDLNGTPGSILATANALVPDSPLLTTALFSNSVDISAGSYYWFSVSTTDLSAAHFWNKNALEQRGTTAFTGALFQSPGEWFYQEELFGAFRVSVSVVPEPSTALLFLGSLLVLSRRLRAKGAG